MTEGQPRGKGRPGEGAQDRLGRPSDCHLAASPMAQTLALVALLVADYDAAIAFYVGTLGFELIEDTPLEAGKRWVVAAPPGSAGTRLLLARAADADQAARIGDQGGGRVWLFLHTDDFPADHARMSAAGVRFLEAPRRESYGWVAVFEDLHGNRWDLLGPGDGAKEAAEPGPPEVKA